MQSGPAPVDAFPFPFPPPPHTLRIPRELILQPDRDLDVHTSQLLDQQLGRVRHRDASDRLFAFAQLAIPAITHLTAYDIVSIGHFNQAKSVR